MNVTAISKMPWIILEKDGINVEGAIRNLVGGYLSESIRVVLLNLDLVASDW
jgi:hypothetical protein